LQIQRLQVELRLKFESGILHDLNDRDLVVLASRNELVARGLDTGHGGSVGLYTANYFVVGAPNLDLTIVATGVAPALFIELNAVQLGGRSFVENTDVLELLGHVGRAPKLDLLLSLNGEAQIVRALGPGEVLHLGGAGLEFEDFALALQVVNENSVLVVVVDDSYVAAAWRD
jgi:hypothetical protein